MAQYPLFWTHYHVLDKSSPVRDQEAAGSNPVTRTKIPPKSGDFGGISLKKLYILSEILRWPHVCPQTGGFFDRWNECPLLVYTATPSASAGGFLCLGLFFVLRRKFCMSLPAFQDDREECPFAAAISKQNMIKHLLSGRVRRFVQYFPKLLTITNWWIFCTVKNNVDWNVFL